MKRGVLGTFADSVNSTVAKSGLFCNCDVKEEWNSEGLFNFCFLNLQQIYLAQELIQGSEDLICITVVPARYLYMQKRLYPGKRSPATK